MITGLQQLTSNSTEERDPPNSEVTASKSDKDSAGLGRFLSAFSIELIAILFWSYAIIQIFIWNVDGFLSTHLPSSISWVLQFKAILFLVALSALFLVAGTRNAITVILRVLVYPFTLVFYRLFRLIYKKRSWTLLIGILNSIISFFASLRLNILVSTAYLTSLIVAVFFHDHYLMISAALVLVALTVLSFARSFAAALAPSKVLMLYGKGIEKIKSWRPRLFQVDEAIRNIPVSTLSEKQLDVWNNNLQSSVLFNRLCLYAANRLRDYQKSDWKILPAIGNLIGVIFLSILSFAGANLALYKFDPTQYVINIPASFFGFFYYSFNVFLFNSIPSVTAADWLAQSLLMIQSALSVFLGLILVTLVLSNRNERTLRDLESIISRLDNEATEAEFFIRDEYRVTNINSAIEHLRNAKTELFQVINWLTRRINSEQ